MDDTTALLICKHIPGLGDKRLETLIHYFETPSEIFSACQADLQHLKIPEKTANAILNYSTITSWQDDLREVEKEKVKLISFQDANYPKGLRAIDNPPQLLYIKGAIPVDSPSVAIVGTRICSIYGREMARTIASDLGASGVTVISGFARGIDTEAHLGALEHGKTVAVLGSGLSQIYPSENRKYVQKVAENGALISEFPMKSKPERFHFPRRNRIVSALCDAIILIEAPEKSGAMITMELADYQLKNCLTLPGRADLNSFKGNHLLLKTGKAQLVENAQDVLSNLKLDGVECLNQAIPKIELSNDEIELLTQLPEVETQIEDILNLTNFRMNEINSLIMGLVIKGIIREFPGRVYKKVSGWQKRSSLSSHRQKTKL